MISVAIVSRSNATGGGASRIAEDLAEWLSKKDTNTVHFCALPEGELKPFQLPLYPPHLLGKLSRTTHRLTHHLGLKELVPVEFFSTLIHQLSHFDVVHFHDLNWAISPLSIRLCSARKPAVFTAHDCSCFTGGCIYPLQCEGFLNKCGDCPQLNSMGASFDFTSFNIRINRWLAVKNNIQYIFPSKWLLEIASKSLHFGKIAKVIPNGFVSEKYEFCSKTEARRKLGICSEKKVVLVAAHYLADPRKGLKFALAAIRAITDLSPLVIFVGIPPPDLETLISGVSFWLSGFVKEPKRLGLLMVAADVFLFPSLQDNFPIMIQEALVAGTPIVGFAVGGISEMVDHGATGFLCEAEDQSALNRNLRNSLSRNNLIDSGMTARDSMRRRFDMDVFGLQHLSIYEELVK